MTDPRQWRVSDAEREHVVGVLQKAIGRGLITLDEFTERADRALAARTREELNVVLLDLTGVVNTERPVAVVAPPKERMELKSTMSSMVRKGAWVVPQALLVRSRMGSTDLDFREADIQHPVVDVELDVAGGSVTMVVPDSATVDANDVEMSASSLRDKVGGVGGRPHFVVRGRMTMGALEIKRKNRWFRGA